jgi:hypothetical protein
VTHSTDHAACAACAAAARTDIAQTLRRYFDSVGDDPARSHERAEALLAHYDTYTRRAHAHELIGRLRELSCCDRDGCPGDCAAGLADDLAWLTTKEAQQ